VRGTWRQLVVVLRQLVQQLVRRVFVIEWVRWRQWFQRGGMLQRFMRQRVLSGRHVPLGQ
jgi:hypothetical protein